MPVGLIATIAVGVLYMRVLLAEDYGLTPTRAINRCIVVHPPTLVKAQSPVLRLAYRIWCDGCQNP